MSDAFICKDLSSALDIDDPKIDYQYTTFSAPAASVIISFNNIGDMSPISRLSNAFSFSDPIEYFRIIDAQSNGSPLNTINSDTQFSSNFDINIYTSDTKNFNTSYNSRQLKIEYKIVDILSFNSASGIATINETCTWKITVNEFTSSDRLYNLQFYNPPPYEMTIEYKLR